MTVTRVRVAVAELGIHGLNPAVFCGSSQHNLGCERKRKAPDDVNERSLLSRNRLRWERAGGAEATV